MKPKQGTRPCVLVFSGLDPSGGAGIHADIEAIGSVRSHALPIITALTVQDNDRVFAVNPVNADILDHQARVLIEKINVSAVKIGIVGNRNNAEVIAKVILQLRQTQPDLPVVLDTVLGSGHGYILAEGHAEKALAPLIPLASIITPNLPEAARLSPLAKSMDEQAKHLLVMGCAHVLIKGGHSDNKSAVVNHWFKTDGNRSWSWPRLAGEFHGSGCTLASTIAGLLAQGMTVERALEEGQMRCQKMFSTAYAIAEGQLIPNRYVT